MASVSSARGKMTALPAKIRSAARVHPAAATGMGRTATAWVTPTSTTSSITAGMVVERKPCVRGGERGFV
jgi:hypothetical protein